MIDMDAFPSGLPKDGDLVVIRIIPESEPVDLAIFEWSVTLDAPIVRPMLAIEDIKSMISDVRNDVARPSIYRRIVVAFGDDDEGIEDLLMWLNSFDGSPHFPHVVCRGPVVEVDALSPES